MNLDYSAREHARQRDSIPDHHREKNGGQQPAGDRAGRSRSGTKSVADPRRHETPALLAARKPANKVDVLGTRFRAEQTVAAC